MTCVETPSKAAAAALSSIDLNVIISKPTETSLLARLKATATETPVKPLVIETPAGDVEEYRQRFVGDLNCTEADEPLLKETTSRFVLFPIKYREVRMCHSVRWGCDADVMGGTDLANV